MSGKLLLITEEDHVEFDNESDLSFFDDGEENISLYVKKHFVGDCKVWKDSDEGGREYITINYNITYLDTLRKI